MSLAGDALELKNRTARRELIPEAEVEATWVEIVRIARDAILSAPARINADLPHLTPFDVATIERHLRLALTGIGEGGSP